jgi:hypothetical protein
VQLCHISINFYTVAVGEGDGTVPVKLLVSMENGHNLGIVIHHHQAVTRQLR